MVHSEWWMVKSSWLVAGGWWAATGGGGDDSFEVYNVSKFIIYKSGNQWYNKAI